jgi:hypothetical protein
MRIVFERTGGFAGRKIQGTIESSSLSKQQAKRLRELLDKSSFFCLPEKLTAETGGADRFSYKITIESEIGIHTVEAAEAAVPPHFRTLLDWLTRSFFLK